MGSVVAQFWACAVLIVLIVLLLFVRAMVRNYPRRTTYLDASAGQPATGPSVWDALDRHLAEDAPEDAPEEEPDDFALWAAELTCRPRIRGYVRRMGGSR